MSTLLSSLLQIKKNFTVACVVYDVYNVSYVRIYSINVLCVCGVYEKHIRVGVKNLSGFDSIVVNHKWQFLPCNI